MKRLAILLIVSICFCKCAEKKETIRFIELKQSEFDAKKYKLFSNKMIDSLKHLHDSCMGISFNANALLAGTKDSFFIGNILKKQSMEVVGTLADLGFDPRKLASQYNVVTTPCYEKNTFSFPLKAMLGGNFAIELPGADELVNKEVNEYISNAKNEVIHAGSWIYLDLNAVLKNIVDTTKSAAGLKYRNNLLDTANVVLTAIESIMSVNFIINTEKEMSKKLQGILINKPSVTYKNLQYPIRFFYIAPDQFEFSVDGFFPVIGKFMKAELSDK